jgi:hypothetical protein
MAQWKNEDDIKADLRAMTAELRKLREGLRNMVSPPKTHPSREFLHRQSWPAPAEPAAAADDDRTRARKSRTRRKKPG